MCEPFYNYCVSIDVLGFIGAAVAMCGYALLETGIRKLRGN